MLRSPSRAGRLPEAIPEGAGVDFGLRKSSNVMDAESSPPHYGPTDEDDENMTTPGVVLEELERKLDLTNVWGFTHTPALQTAECIAQVKQSLMERVAEKEDAHLGISPLWFLAAACVLPLCLILLLWNADARLAAA